MRGRTGQTGMSERVEQFDARRPPRDDPTIRTSEVPRRVPLGLGDNGGYWIGTKGGGKLRERWGPVAKHAKKVLPRAERLFAKHGGKTVFFGRFIAVLRITAAWMAGISHMPWWRFLAYNAAGGIAWAVAVALVAFYLGRAAADLIGRYGLIGGGAVVGLAIAGFAAMHLWRRRMEDA